MTVARGLVVTVGLAGCGGMAADTGPGLGDVEARLGALEEQIATLEGQLSAAQTEVAAVQGQVDALAPDVVTAKDGVVALTFDVATLTADLDALDGRVSSAEASEVALGAAVDELTTEIAVTRAGVATLIFPDFDTISGTDTTIHDMGSVTVTPPGPGQLLVVLTGYAVFFGQGRSIDVGIGDSATALDASIDLGDLDGVDTSRTQRSFTVAETYPATGAAVTFHALALGNATFDAVSVNVVPQQLTVLFVPEEL